MHVHMCTGMRLGTGTCTGTGTGTCTDLDTGTGTGTGTGTVRATSMHMHEHACMRSHGTRVRAHVCGQLQRAVHPHHTHTHTHMCTQRDAHVHAHAREHPAHLHTELTRQLIKDTAHAASFAALPARARACQLALPKTLRLWDHAQLSCLIVSTKWPSPTFPTLLASVANFLAHLLALLASTLQICTAILCMHCNLHCNCIRCRFFDQGMRNLHALQHLQLQDLQIGLQLCAICLQIWLAHVHACFCLPVLCKFALQLHTLQIFRSRNRNLHALQHLQDLQIGLQY